MKEEDSDEEDSDSDLQPFQEEEINQDFETKLEEMNANDKRLALRQQYMIDIFKEARYVGFERQKSKLQCFRTNAMGIMEYQQFEHCREKNLLSRGKKAFLQYVQVAK